MKQLKTPKLAWGYVRLSPETMQALHKEAQRRQLVPLSVSKGQDPVRVGIVRLIEAWVKEQGE